MTTYTITITQFRLDDDFRVEITRDREVEAKARFDSGEEVIPFLIEQLLYSGRLTPPVKDDVGVPFTVEDHSALASVDLKEVLGPRVYFVQGAEGGPIKIGYTTNMASRLSALQTSSPVSLRVLLTVSGSRSDEQGCHVMFRHERLHGEWFRPSAKLLVFIKRLSEGKPLSLEEAAKIEEEDRGPT